jgi:PAS domain S-box-containing protein
MDGAVVCVAEATIEQHPCYVSTEFCEFTGYALEEVLGRNCRFLQGPGTTQESRDAVKKLVMEERSGCVSLINYTKRGEEFENTLYICPLYCKSSGALRFFLGSQIDLLGRVNTARNTRSFKSEGSSSGPTAPGLDFVRNEAPASPTERPRGWSWHWTEDAKSGKAGAMPESATSGHGPFAETVDSNVSVHCCGVTMRANEGPFRFETDLAMGAVEIATKTSPIDPRVAQLFDGNERRVCLQLQITYKNVPTDVKWFIGAEIEGSLQVDFKTRVIANFFLMVLRCYEPRTMYSLGGNGTNAFIAFPMERIEPALAAPEKGQAYYLEVGAAPMDLENWQIVDVPQGTKRDLRVFWGKRGARMYIVAQFPDGTMKRALELDVDWLGHQQ